MAGEWQINTHWSNHRNNAYNSLWYKLPVRLNLIILLQCDILGKLSMATLSPTDRDLVHKSVELFPRGATLVGEQTIFIVCRRLFLEKITFRLRWSASRNRFIIFSPRSSRVQAVAPAESRHAIPAKAWRYLCKKTAFEALYNVEKGEYMIIGMGNSCDFQF